MIGLDTIKDIILVQKINNEFGWSPKENFNSGLTKTIEWYLNLILRLKN